MSARQKAISAAVDSLIPSLERIARPQLGAGFSLSGSCISMPDPEGDYAHIIPAGWSGPGSLIVVRFDHGLWQSTTVYYGGEIRYEDEDELSAA
jgi:hypothetical protein